MNNKIIFLHIPRTGGTTFRDILERFYHSENVIEIKKFIESEETIRTYTKDEQSKIKLIKGHLNFGIHELINGDCKYITFLRDPIKRIVSTFKYANNNVNHSDHDFVRSISLQDYIESKRNLLLDNGITRLLLGPRYVFDTAFGTINKKHYSMALDNLDKYFAVAGITERYNESLLVLKNELQWNSPFYSIANKSKKNNELFDLNTNDQIMQCYFYDLKIYNYVNKMLDNKINSIPNFDLKLKKFNLMNSLVGRLMINQRLKRLISRIIKK